ncbi:MAG: glycosyltransferase [Pirellulales bacterium]
MNLAEQGNILYVSMADVTAPNGPGVNEREFLLSLYERLGDRVHAVLPLPRRCCDEIDRARTTFYAHPRRWNIVGFLWQQAELYRIVKRMTSTARFDLIVVRLSVIPLAIYFLSRYNTRFAIKTLGDIQGFTQNRGLKGIVAKILGPINIWLFRRIVSRAIAVDCCTETHYRDHVKDFRLPEARLRVVENATNVARFTPGDPSAAKATLRLSRFTPVLGFVGGSPAERGGMQMLEVAAQLASDFPDLGVVIVGHDQGGLLKRRAKELGLEDRTALPGLVSYELIPTYVNSFDVGFALDRPERMQTTGNSYQKVRQYLACGKPVITCVEERSELVRQGLVESVAPDDLGALQSAVRKLLARDAGTRTRQGLIAVRFVRERLSTQFTLAQRFEFWDQQLRAA